MKSNLVKRISSVLFLIAGGLTILEFLFVQGMFTAPIMMLMVGILAIINIILEIRDKQFLYALHYLLTSIALCMGYSVL